MTSLMPVKIEFQFCMTDDEYTTLKRGREGQTDEETFTRVIQTGCSYLLIENLRDQVEQLMAGKQAIYFKPLNMVVKKSKLLPQDALERGGV